MKFEKNIMTPTERLTLRKCLKKKERKERVEIEGKDV